MYPHVPPLFFFLSFIVRDCRSLVADLVSSPLSLGSKASLRPSRSASRLPKLAAPAAWAVPPAASASATLAAASRSLSAAAAATPLRRPRSKAATARPPAASAEVGSSISRRVTSVCVRAVCLPFPLSPWGGVIEYQTLDCGFIQLFFRTNQPTNQPPSFSPAPGFLVFTSFSSPRLASPLTHTQHTHAPSRLADFFFCWFDQNKRLFPLLVSSFALYHLICLVVSSSPPSALSAF